MVVYPLSCHSSIFSAQMKVENWRQLDTDGQGAVYNLERKYSTVKCDSVHGNQAFGHAIDICIQACIVSYFGEFLFFALMGARRIL